MILAADDGCVLNETGPHPERPEPPAAILAVPHAARLRRFASAISAAVKTCRIALRLPEPAFVSVRPMAPSEAEEVLTLWLAAFRLIIAGIFDKNARGRR